MPIEARQPSDLRPLRSPLQPSAATGSRTFFAFQLRTTRQATGLPARDELVIWTIWSFNTAVTFDVKELDMARSLYVIALVLVVVGALNWGLVGLAQFDLVASLFGGQSAVLSRVVYSLVGLAGIALAA